MGLPAATASPPALTIPNSALEQKYAPFKKPTELKYADPNFAPEEKRAYTKKYYVARDSTNMPPSGIDSSALAAEETRGKKRARAEDFL
jgi:hypothetical protein